SQSPLLRSRPLGPAGPQRGRSPLRRPGPSVLSLRVALEKNSWLALLMYPLVAGRTRSPRLYASGSCTRSREDLPRKLEALHTTRWIGSAGTRGGARDPWDRSTKAALRAAVKCSVLFTHDWMLAISMYPTAPRGMSLSSLSSSPSFRPTGCRDR